MTEYPKDGWHYPENLCGWSKWKRFWDRYGWIKAENEALQAEYRRRYDERKRLGPDERFPEDHPERNVPFPPYQLMLRG